MTDSSVSLEIRPIDAHQDNILGYGINCITGKAVVGDSCVENVIKLASNELDEDRLHVEVLKSSADLTGFMSASVSVHASGLSWSASASASYAMQNASHDLAISYVALRQIRTCETFIDITKAKIASAALEVLKGPDGPSAFIDKYGTHCVIGVAYGASFTGYIRLDTHSAMEKDAMSTSLSASISAFGNKASVNADFSTGRSQITTDYGLKADSLAVGATRNTFDRSDPDGLLEAARGIAPDGNGAPVAFLCATWDQFSDIQNALNDIGQPQALSLSSAMSALSQLSAEYAALAYVINTCQQMIDDPQFAFAIPAQRGLAGRLIAGAADCQNRITRQRIQDLETISASDLQALMISSGLNLHLKALTSRSVLVNLHWYLDAAFEGGGDHWSTTVKPMDQMGRVVEVNHRDNTPDLYIHLGSDPQGYYLITQWDNHDGHWDSERVDIGGDSINTAPATAAWAPCKWNYIEAKLVDF